MASQNLIDMIKFFRRIRQSLLTENLPTNEAGRLSKYLIYAIGEIILVVIGILIALQINNWNENRKDRNREKDLMSAIVKEFVADSLRLNNMLKGIEEKANQGSDLITYLTDDQKEIDTSKILSDIYIIGRFIQYDPSFPTFEEIIASGQSTLIRSNTFKEQIKSYLTLAEYHEAFLYEEGRTNKALYNQHIRKYFDYRMFSDYWGGKGGINLSRIKNKFNEEDLLIDFKGFHDDPETLYFTRQVAGTDEELKAILTIVKTNFLAPTIKTLREEIEKRR